MRGGRGRCVWAEGGFDLWAGVAFCGFFLFHCWGEESSAKVCSDVAEEGR